MVTNMTKIQATTMAGREIKDLTPLAIRRSFKRDADEFGEAFVYEHNTMVGITKWRDTKRGPFTYTVDECYVNQRGDVVEMLTLDFTSEEIDDAIDTFIYLVKHPKTAEYEKILKKIGPYTILK